MKKLMMAAIVLVALNHPVRGEEPSSVQPIYPEPNQQTDNIWGVKEIAHCPDGYKLSWELSSEASPVCIPMTAKALAGGSHE